MFIHSSTARSLARARQVGQLTPSPARETRAYIRFPLFWSLCLSLPFLHAIEAASEGPTWNRHSISGLAATNTLDATPKPESAPRDPSRLALERLSQTEASEPPAQWPAVEGERRIAEFGEYRAVDEVTLEERMEHIRIELLMEEANMLVRQGDDEGASHLLKGALDKAGYDSSRFTLHRRLGAMAFRRQDYEGAAVHMAEALALQPNDPATASNLAAAQMTLGDLDAALETLQGIQLGLIQHRQLLFSVHFNLACLYSMKEETEQAITHLLEAAESDPPSAFASLGDPQLDAIRNDLRFRDLQLVLESMLSGQ